MTRPRFDALTLHKDDNVATALRPLEPGEAARIRIPDGEAEVVVREAIPLCHKIAVQPLDSDATVIKYGAPIGRLVRPVERGALVHVHNLASGRGRGAQQDGA